MNLLKICIMYSQIESRVDPEENPLKPLPSTKKKKSKNSPDFDLRSQLEPIRKVLV